MNEQTTLHKDRARTILEALEHENVQPTSRLVFRLRNHFVWALWAFTVLLGAASVSIIFFALSNGWYGMYEATHDSWFAFMIESLPFVWIPIFAALVMVAYVNVRQTDVGYRYPFWQIVGSSLIFSLLIGVFFTMVGFAHDIDKLLGERVPLYPSQARLERELWQRPDVGRLIGVAFRSPETETISFIDSTGENWLLVTTGLQPVDMKELLSRKQVRLMGVATPGVFHACAVLPGFMSDQIRASDRAPYYERVRERLLTWRQSSRSLTSLTHPCMDMPQLQSLE